MCPKSAQSVAVNTKKKTEMSTSTTSASAMTTTTTVTAIAKAATVAAKPTVSRIKRNSQNYTSKNNNNHDLTGAIGNINCTSGAIRIDNNQVNAKFKNNGDNKNANNNNYNIRISNCKSFTVARRKKRRRITLTSKELPLTLLISVVLILQAKYTTTTTTTNKTATIATTANITLYLNTTMANGSASKSATARQNIQSITEVKQATKTKSIKSVIAGSQATPITSSTPPPALSLISATTITSVHDTLPVDDTQLPASTSQLHPPPFYPLPIPVTKPTHLLSLTTPTRITSPAENILATSESSVNINTIDSVVAVAATDNSIESITVGLQPPPPPSDVLIKGFSIPTFLPPFPAFAMADLPSYTSAPTSAASVTTTLSTDPQDQLYLASYKQNSAGHNLSMPETNITVQMGNHAYLPCNIQRILNKPISWVRLRDGHILSVDQATFIADQRFQSIFQGENDFTWSLQIKYVQAADEGWYECQVSSEPKQSAKVYLGVVVPHTELIGDQNRFVKAGSKVALHCIVRGTLDPPTYIIWFRGKTQITNDNEMGWYTEIDRTIFGDVESNRNTIGSLIIPFVKKKDSGNYTCQPSNSAPVSVDLHVLSGEYSASAIMSAANSYRFNENIIYHLIFAVMLFILPET